jgi:hypothetical protein
MEVGIASGNGNISLSSSGPKEIPERRKFKMSTSKIMSMKCAPMYIDISIQDICDVY